MFRIASQLGLQFQCSDAPTRTSLTQPIIDGTSTGNVIRVDVGGTEKVWMVAAEEFVSDDHEATVANFMERMITNPPDISEVEKLSHRRPQH